MLPGGLFLLLLIAILVHLLGNRVLPLFMPTGRVKTLAAGFLGGLLGHWVGSIFFPWGPRLWELHLIPAFMGSILFTLALGLAPFFRILLGRA